MKLLEIEIKNLKSITNAKLKFPASKGYQVSLLYGDNGAGKTTVLEAISLLGHVSTMRRICAVEQGKVDKACSRFREYKEESNKRSPNLDRELRARVNEEYKPDAFKDQCELISRLGVEGWWASTSVGGDAYRPACLKYSILFNNQPLEFYISFLQRRDLSITEALSRDQNGPGETIHDGSMDNWFAIVYSLAQREHVETLIEHMRMVSPHSYWSKAEKYQTDQRTTKRAEGHSIVAYWNTDLNDFGRKNDLRESVKKVRIDFTGQMITRLGLALPYSHQHQNLYYEMTANETVEGDKLEVLNESLKRAIVDHAVAMQRATRKPNQGLIRIAEIDATKDPASIKARRIDDANDIEIDHLSAGENESVFIFLLMHGMPCRDSIILLDEPDLHLSDFAKARFYRELYEVARPAECQLIISTHSAYAYATDDRFSHHFIRREWEKNEMNVSVLKYKTEWSNAFGELLTFYYARCAVNAMRESGPIWKLLSIPLRVSIRIGEMLGLWVWVLVTIFFAFLGAYSVLATVNDIFLFLDDNPTLHKQIIVVAAIFCLTSCLLCILVRFVPRLMRKG